MNEADFEAWRQDFLRGFAEDLAELRRDPEAWAEYQVEGELTSVFDGIDARRADAPGRSRHHLTTPAPAQTARAAPAETVGPQRERHASQPGGVWLKPSSGLGPVRQDSLHDLPAPISSQTG